MNSLIYLCEVGAADSFLIIVQFIKITVVIISSRSHYSGHFEHGLHEAVRANSPLQYYTQHRCKRQTGHIRLMFSMRDNTAETLRE